MPRSLPSGSVNIMKMHACNRASQNPSFCMTVRTFMYQSRRLPANPKMPLRIRTTSRRTAAPAQFLSQAMTDGGQLPGTFMNRFRCGGSSSPCKKAEETSNDCTSHWWWTARNRSR